jgi:septum formation protein
VCYLHPVLSNRSRLVLGSASPRRRELLELAGFTVEIVPTAIDESVLVDESADAYLERIVASKLRACRERVGSERTVIVADTTVIRDRSILGKPESDAHAREMVTSLAGRRHVVATRFAIQRGGDIVSETVETTVEFRLLTTLEVADYVATGEGRDKAGSYAIQGRGAAFVRRIEGSYTNVVGLPLSEVVEALRRLDGG